MARRRYTRARRYTRRAGNSMKPMVDGLLAGAGGNVLSGFIGNWGTPIATLGVGWFRKNTTLKTIGGMQLGYQLGSMIPVIGNKSGGSNGSGLFE